MELVPEVSNKTEASWHVGEADRMDQVVALSACCRNEDGDIGGAKAFGHRDLGYWSVARRMGS